MKLKANINNKFTDNLPADILDSNETRQVVEAAFSFVNPVNPKKPKLC